MGVSLNEVQGHLEANDRGLGKPVKWIILTQNGEIDAKMANSLVRWVLGQVSQVGILLLQISANIRFTLQLENSGNFVKDILETCHR